MEGKSARKNSQQTYVADSSRHINTPGYVSVSSLMQEINEENPDSSEKMLEFTTGEDEVRYSVDRMFHNGINEESFVVISHPPASHSLTKTTGYASSPPTPQSEINITDFPTKNDKFIENRQWRDTETIFGKVVEVTGVSKTQSISHKDNKEQLKYAATVVDNVATTPLTEFWHKLTRIFFVMVFFANVIVEILDIVDSPLFLHYKLTALVFATVENIIVVFAWAVFTFSRKYNSLESAKHKQYIENIAHELLLYPLIVLSVLGFSTEKMYEGPDGALAWTQVTFLVFFC